MADLSNLPEVLQSNLDTNIQTQKSQEQLQKAMATFTSSNKMFAKTSVALNDFAKQQVTKLNPFKSLKDKFDKSFIGQKVKLKKEEENLAKAAGITREELLLIKANKELKESQKAQADALKDSFDEYGLNVNTFFNEAGELQTRMAERDEKGRFQSAKTIVDGIVGSMESGQMQEIENRREQARRDEEQSALMASLVGGLKDLGDNLLKGLKGLGEGGASGLGIFAGLVAAPFIVLSNFFSQVKKEFKVLKDFTKTKLFAPFQKLGNWLKGLGAKFKSLVSTKFSGPFKNFGNWLKGLGGQFKGLVSNKLGTTLDPVKNLGANLKSAGNQLKASTTNNIINPLKNFGNTLKTVGTSLKEAGKAKIIAPAAAAVSNVKGFFSNIGNTASTAFKQGGKFESVGRIGSLIKDAFGKNGKFAGISKAFSSGFQPIARFAASAGRLLGKLFLPVTIIMGVIDGVKGFMEGFSEEGILGGLFGAIEGVLTGLVALPLDLLKDGVSWVAEKLGFEKFSAMLDSFSFEGIFDTIFNGLQDLRTMISDKISDFWQGTKSFFGFGESEEEKAERLNERKERDNLIEQNRLEKRAEREGTSVEELRAKLEKEKAEELAAAEAAKAKIQARNDRRGMGAGGNKGAEINAQSAQAAVGAGNVVVTTVSPTNINAPTSTSVSNQTNVTPTASRSRNRRRGRSYSPA